MQLPMKDNISFAFPTLNTDRLILRQLSESDAQEIFLLRSDANVNKYLGRKPNEYPEEALDFIRNIVKNEMLYWGIETKDSGKLAGTICLFDVSEEFKKCEIGYELLPDQQGKGIMAEAIRAILAFATDTLGMKEIDAVTHQDNENSSKALRKFNFEKTEFVDEENPDLILFRLSV